MYKIRQISYAPTSVSIQVYKIENRKRVIVRHIGIARSEQEKADLLTLAHDFIEKISKQLFIFEDSQSGKVLYINQTAFIGVYYSFSGIKAYRTANQCFDQRIYPCLQKNNRCTIKEQTDRKRNQAKSKSDP